MIDPVHFVDLRAQHEEVRNEIESAISDLIDQSRFIGGDPVSNFEREFADYLGVKHAVGCGNGTDALWLAMVAAGIGAGDAVIIQPNTFIASVEAITRTGAHSLFVDIDLDLATLDIRALRSFLEEQCHRNDQGDVFHTATERKVAAIMPVHLYGLPTDMAPLMQLVEDYSLFIIEDACQAHGAEYKINGNWKKMGTFGLAAGFSFYPGKNLGAMGDAGAVVTDDPELAEKMRWLRTHGSSEKYVHPLSQGWNSRLDSIQAAVLSAKLKKLDHWNGLRRQAAEHYRNALAGLPLSLPIEPEYAKHVYHLYVIRHLERDRIQKELGTRNIHGIALSHSRAQTRRIPSLEFTSWQLSKYRKICQNIAFTAHASSINPRADRTRSRRFGRNLVKICVESAPLSVGITGLWQVNGRNDTNLRRARPV